MRIEQSVSARRMNVAVRIRVPMMLPVLLGPPQHTALSRRLAEKAKAELEQPTGLERTMSEIPMVPGAN
jgi:hypothetical protein